MASVSSTPSKAELSQRFINSGERERMKELLAQRLRESGWVEQVEVMARNFIRTKGVDQVTLEDVVEDVTGRARRAVPDEVKRELMQCIRTFLQQESGISDL